MEYLSAIDLNRSADAVKGIANIVGLVLVVVTVWAWRARHAKADIVTRQVRARQAFARFTHEVMLQPDISTPATAGGVASARYRQFMQLLLTTIDEILSLDPRPEWRSALRRQLAPHGEYLASPGFRDGLFGALSTETRELIRSVTAANSPRAHLTVGSA